MTEIKDKVRDGLSHCFPANQTGGCEGCPYQSTCSVEDTVVIPAAMLEDIRQVVSP